MNLLTEWVKPNGNRLKLNNEEETIEQAKKLGWKPFDGTPEGIAEAEEVLVARELRAELAVEAAKELEQPAKTKASSKN